MQYELGADKDESGQERSGQAEPLGSGQASHWLFHVKGCTNIGFMFAWQAPSRLAVQSDSDWAGRQEHAEERVSWEHSLRPAFASHLQQRPDWHCDELRRSTVVRCVHGSAAGYANGEHGKRAASASRAHGAGRQRSHWNHRQAGTGESETCGRELLLAAGSCAMKTCHPQECAVEKEHGRSWDGSTPEADK